MREEAVAEARTLFEREIGATGVQTVVSNVGNRPFLKFVVGRDAPIYTYALDAAQRALSAENMFKGTLGIRTEPPPTFPGSLEANALLTLLTRSTREVSEDADAVGFRVPYIPFQNREDHQLAQPASHIVWGRRGAGKSTLIRRAVELLAHTPAIVAVLDMQAYSTLDGEDLIREVVHDVVRALRLSALKVGERMQRELPLSGLLKVARDLMSKRLAPTSAAPPLKRAVQELTRATDGNAFVFLDDYHLVESESQPVLLHILHGGLKGAKGWLKVAGLRSLLNYYSSGSRRGLQMPGDAQPLSLDLTLENPEAASDHLRAIAGSFMVAVGHTPPPSRVLPKDVLRRLAWANAGVPRDFLQMLARALEHAQRNKHASITLSDVNMAIGEFGQRKIDDLQRDARNAAGALMETLKALEVFCLEKKKVNAFLLRSEESVERRNVHALSDLRMVHLIQQSITPERAGERYEAFILDYSMFTGYRRRRVTEMVPAESQFKAGELRKLPKVEAGTLSSLGAETSP